MRKTKKQGENSLTSEFGRSTAVGLQFSRLMPAGPRSRPADYSPHGDPSGIFKTFPF